MKFWITNSVCQISDCQGKRLHEKYGRTNDSIIASLKVVEKIKDIVMTSMKQEMMSKNRK